MLERPQQGKTQTNNLVSAKIKQCYTRWYSAIEAGTFPQTPKAEAAAADLEQEQTCRMSRSALKRIGEAPTEECPVALAIPGRKDAPALNGEF